MKVDHICNTFLKRARGLMFRKPSSALLISPSESIQGTSIHMFFVFFPIDVYWLDKNKKVVDKKLNLQPFISHGIPKVKAKYVLEVPKNKSNFNLGDKIECGVSSKIFSKK